MDDIRKAKLLQRDDEDCRESYAEAWGPKAQWHRDQGHYTWMESHIHEYKKVLEIGSGTGESTLALATNGHVVVSVEENYTCFSKALSRLREAQIPVRTIDRRESTRFDWIYNRLMQNYRMISEPVSSSTMLITGDVLEDQNLLAWLPSNYFDAVVCWMIGTHGARAGNHTNAGKYRLFLQKKLYHLAGKVLRPEGVVQMVDRKSTPTEELKEKILHGHAGLASNSGMEVGRIDCLEMPSLGPTTDISCGPTVGPEEDHGNITPANVSLVSIIAKKS